MSIELITIIMFGSLVAGLISGLPITFVLGGIGVAFTYFFWGAHGLGMITYQVYTWATSIFIIAVPLFVFMGVVLEQAGIIEGMFETVYRCSGSLRGGIAVATVITCAVLAAMTGLTATSTISMGMIALPAMLRRNYNKHLAIGSIATAGTFGILIPPSVMMIIYGLITGESVGRLFAAGIIPGILLTLLLIAYILLRAFLQPDLAPSSQIKYTLREKVVSIKSVIAPTSLIIAVLGSIFAGVATPTEAAAIGAFGTLICAFLNHRLNWQLIKHTCYTTISISGMAVWIVMASACFVGIFTALGSIELVSKAVIGLEVSRWVILVGIIVILVIMGCFLEPGAIILLFAPIFVPIIKAQGFDPIWFAIVFIILLQIGYLTPPFGFNLFYMKSVSPPEISMVDIIRSVIPFIGIMILGLFIVMAFPPLVTWLPNMIFK